MRTTNSTLRVLISALLLALMAHTPLQGQNMAKYKQVLIDRCKHYEQLLEIETRLLKALEEKKALAVTYVEGDYAARYMHTIPLEWDRDAFARALHGAEGKSGPAYKQESTVFVDREKYLRDLPLRMELGELQGEAARLGKYQKQVKAALSEVIKEHRADLTWLQAEMEKSGGFAPPPVKPETLQNALNLMNLEIDKASQPARTGAKTLAITEASATPGEVEVGQKVQVKAVYWATELASPSLRIDEKITVTLPKGTPLVRACQREFGEKQHSNDPALMDGACRPVFEIVPGVPGRYTCRIEIQIEGVAKPVVREVSFTAKAKPKSPVATTTGADAGKPVWIRQKAVLGKGFSANWIPGEMPKHLQGPCETGWACVQPGKDGKMVSTSIRWQVPPERIVHGQTVTLSMQRNADGPFANYWMPSGTAQDGKGPNHVGVHPSIQYSFRFEPSSEKDAYILVDSGAALDKEKQLKVVWPYKKLGDGEKEGAGPPNPPKPPDDEVTTVTSVTPPAEEKPCELKAWLTKDTITLVPGEISQICGVHVSGWRGNTEERVEVLIDVQDGFGGLRANPGIVVGPGPTSASPGNMFNTGVSDSGGRYYFSELWSARSTAAPGTTVVPIVVRQKGCGQVALSLKVVVLPKRGRAKADTLPADVLSNALNAGLQIGTAAQSAFHERFNRPDLRQITSKSLGAAREAAAALPPAAATDLTAFDRLLRNLANMNDTDAYIQINKIRGDMLNSMMGQMVFCESGGSFPLARVGEIGVYLGWITMGAQFYGDAPLKMDMVVFIRGVCGEMRSRVDTVNKELGQVWFDPKLIDEIVRLADSGATGTQIRAATHAAFFGMYRSAGTVGTRGLGKAGVSR
jgi:hypothetical protein